jgi:hypothetical protein
MNTRKLIVAFLIAVTVLGGAILVSDARFAISTPTQPLPQGNTTVEQAADFSGYELYNAGASFDGLPLTAVQRVDAAPNPLEPVRADSWTFVYGNCTVTSSEEGGCALPVQIQIWPACERNPSVYPPDETREPVKVRGVPGFLYEDGTRLELTTGSSTVVIFGHPARLLDVAKRLVPANGLARSLGVTQRTNLPKPKAGAVEGTLACGFDRATPDAGYQR